MLLSPVGAPVLAASLGPLSAPSAFCAIGSDPGPRDYSELIRSGSPAMCTRGDLSARVSFMNKLILLLLTAALSLAAQETRREAVHASTNPADDTRPNSDRVPDVYAIDVRLERVVVLRFKFGTDLLAGLEKMIQEKRIRNALILSGFGSVRNFQVHQVSNRDMPPRDMFVKNPAAPADIISMSGVISEGRVHSHITLANADKAFGGHLEPGTNVFTFAVVTLGVLGDDVDLSRVDDWKNR